MPSKIFRDPLYNYISINSNNDRSLIELLDCPEVQRLRRIHQLGISEITYPGASHTRFAHTLGVFHLMQQTYEQIESTYGDDNVRMGRPRLLAAAILHDVGHGPFSHLFEPCLGTRHEAWSIKIVQNTEGNVNKVLRKIDPTLPNAVVQLIDENDVKLPHWQKSLLSSQLDVDRMDYLRRDSLFTGAGYGHFDWYRLINTLELHDGLDDQRDIVWPEKAKFAIEEFIFARYYMYQNVYLHKTTRGFEKLLVALWNHAKELRRSGDDVDLMPAIDVFWKAEQTSGGPTTEQYLAIEECTVLQQIKKWTDHKNKPLSDLARRFLTRDRFAMIEAPPPSDDWTDGYEKWEMALKDVVKKAGFNESTTYCLLDRLEGKYYQPYTSPEREVGQQSALNAIRVLVDSEPVEISDLLPRLKSTTKPKTETATGKPPDRYRYYVPQEARKAAEMLKRNWSN